MNLSAQFKAFLLSQKKRPSEVTVKNYLADVSQFISWCEKNGTAFIPHQISHKMLQDYLAAKQLSLASRERHLSSLRKFFTFLKEEKLVTELPFPSSTKPTSDDPWSLHDFRSHLTLNKASHPTVKNYLTDIKHFTSWIASKHAKLGTQAISHSYFALVTDKALEEYKASLQESGFSTPSINRKLSSLRRYLHWASEKGLPEAKSVSIANISKKKEPVINEANQATMNQAAIDTTLPSPTSLTDPLGILNPVKGTISGTTEPVQNTEATPSTKEELTQSFHAIMHEPKNPSYSRFAPLRLVQKLRHGIILALDVTIVAGTAYVIEHMAYMRWIASGKQIFTASAKNGLSHGDSKNSSFSLKLFAQLGTLASQFMAVVYPPAHSYRHDMAKHHKAFYHMRHTRPNWYKKYHELPMVHYFHFAALVIMMSAIGFMGYRAFFDDTGTSQAALPTAPPRVLSFQGRLTDNFDNPIDSATSLRFAIYNDLSASGAAMLWQEVQSTTPDQDGIFSVLLGSSTSIPDSVFRENSALYLGITVGTDSELQPRQQIATVAFAANSESLQGLLPITAGGAGTSNVVLALDSTGNLTIGGSATPTFEATGGQFTLSGNVLNLTTTAGTNSNVQLNPDGTGTIDVMKPLQNSTLNNNIPSAAGAVEVNDMFAVLATSSGQSAFTLNQDGAGPILSASSSGIARFTVSNNGTGYFAGNVGIGSTTPAYKLDVQGGSGVVGRFSGRVIGANAVNTNEFVTLSQLTGSVSGSTFWQLNSNALSPINSTYDVLVGSTATSSALVKLGGTSNATSFFNTGGNVGIGTTAPAAKLDISTDGAGPQTLLTLRGASTGINQSYSFVMNADKTVTISGGSSNTKTIFQATNASGFAPLAVRGAASQTSNLFQVENSSGTALSVFNGSGNLGIGTTTPGSLVDIYGASPTLTFRNSGGPNLADTGVILFSETVAPAGIKLRYDGSTGTGGGTFNITDITSGVNTDLVSVMRNGNVGIGTTTPGSKLHVNGSAFFNTNTETTPFVIGRTNLTSEVLQIGINDANLNMNYVNDEASSRWNFGVQNTDTESGGGVNASNYTILTLYGSTGGGNVGIGSITPGYKLDVQDGTGIVARFSGRVIGADAVNTNEFVTLSQLTSGTGQYWSRTGSNLYPSTITDNVGIGTTTPGAALDVLGGVAGVNIASFNRTNGAIAGVNINAASGDPQLVFTTNATSRFALGYDTSNSSFNIAESGALGTTDRFVIKSGNVGIGSTTPGTTLDVTGTGRFSGTLTANGSFVANNSFTLGDGGDTGSINTSSWDISTAGAATGFTGIVSSGNIDLSSLSAGGMVKADVTTGRLSVATAGTDYEVPLTFGNGLTRTSNAVSLGGTITGNTDIALGGYNFTLSGLGNVGIGTTTPSSKLSLVSNGSVANLFDITDNGSTIFQVTQSNIVANVPAQFNAAGDVSIAYDLNFTNPTASYIKSSAPLYMTAGEVFGSSDLTLRTYNSGNVIVDSQALSVTGSATVSGQLTVGGTTTLSNYTTNGGVLYTNGSGTIAQSDAPATNECLTYNGTSPVWDSCASGGGITGSGTLNYLPKFTPNGSTLGDSTIYDNGNVGIGTTTTSYNLTVNGTFGAVGTLGTISTSSTGNNLNFSRPSANYINATDAAGSLQFGAGGVSSVFNISPTGATAQTMTLVNGNVGIGSTAPGATLDVTGTGRFSGTLTANGSFVANNSFTLGDGGDTGAVDTSTWDITSAGVASGFTGITSSGTITFSGLTAARAVFTTTGGQLTTTGTSADLASTLSNETGTGVVVFGTSPSITTALNTGSTTFNLVNTTATTVNFAGASTALTIGATTGTTTIRNATTALTGVLNVNGSGNSYFTGNLGIGSTSPGKKLDVAGDINMTSGLYYNNSPLNIELTRTLPTTANDYVEIGTMTVGSGAHNLRISVTVPSTGFSTSKTYLIPLSYNQTNDVWQTALPISDSGEYSGNNYALDVKVGTTIATLRLRRTAGTTAGTAYVRLESTGYTSDAFATLTGTGSTTAPSTNLATTSITQTNGRLGVGTNSPSYLLDVQGGTGIVGQFSGRVIGADAVNSNEFVTLSQLTSGTGQYWTDAGTYIYPTGGEVLGNSASAGSNKIAGIYLADSAPMTFGTDNDVTFSFSGSELAISQGNNDINFDSNTLVIDGITNRVGIGTTAPGEELDVIGEIQFGAGTRKGRLFAQDSGFTPNPGSSTLGAVLEGAYQGHLALDLLNNDAGDSIAFRYSAGNTGAVDTVGFVMKANGNVGIGSITPAHKLDVAGTGQFTGLLTLGAQATGTTHAVRADRDLIAGSGLTGGGNLTADRTFNVGAGSCVTVAADTVGVTANCVDATTLDSIDSGSFLRSDTSDQFTSGTLTFNSGTTLDINGDLSIADTNIVFDGASTNFATTGNFSINTSQFFINQSNGYVGLGTTSPTSKLSLVSDGTVANLFDITDNGSTIFQVTQANMISNVPAQFNAAGDVSIAYDLLFTNPTASNIQSLSPLTISAGETFNSSNLTLQTYNAGNVVVDSQALTLTGSATIAAELTLSSKTTNGGVLYTNGSGTIAQSDAPSTNECLTYNGTSPVWDSCASGGGITGSGTANYISKFTGPGSIGDSSIYDNGNVGIGTTNPLAKLQLHGMYSQGGTPYGTADFTLRAADATTGMAIKGSSTYLLRLLDASDNPLFNVGGTGNVGIGTTTTPEKLTISAGNIQLDNNYSVKSKTNVGGIVNLLTYTSGNLTRVGANTEIELGGYVAFRPAGVEVARIISSGNFGIGTTAPAAKLNVSTSGTAGIVEALRLGYNNAVNSGSSIGFWAGNTTTETARIEHNLDSSTTSSLRFYTYNSGLGERLRISANGNIGIGTTAPSSLLSVGSTSQFQVNSSGAIAAATGITSSGNITFSGLTAARAVFTTTGGLLTTTGTSADLAASLSNETGTGVAVFGTSPSITTALNTGSTTFSLVNTTATTLNFAGAATNITMGATTGTTTIRNATTSITGNLGIGTTTPGTRLHVAGNAYIEGATKEYFSGQETRTYRNVAQYNIDAATQTGTVKIAIPTAKNNSTTMQVIKITGYNYVDNGGAWEAIVSGYNYSSGWINTSAEIRGSAPFTSVRLGTDGTTDVILLGDTSTVWQYPQFFIDTVHVGYNSEDGFDGTWTLSMITDETGITVEKTPTIKTYIATNGNFGIGTTSPSYKLDVQGGTGIVGQFSGRVIGANAVNSNEFVTLSQLTGGTGQYWTRTGGNLYPSTITDNVGIGTSSPGSLLHVDGTGELVTIGDNLHTDKYMLFRNDVSNGMAIGYSDATIADTNGTGLIRTGSKAFAVSTGDSTAFDSVTTADFVITSTGNVGIGTTTPASLLQVRGSAPSLVLNNTTTNTANSGTIDFLEDDNALGSAAGYGFRLNYEGVGNRFAISSGNTTTVDERLTILRSNGNVGIGSTAPGFKLDVAGTGRFTGLLTLGAQATGTTHAVRADRDLIAGSGLTGGGNLTADRTFNVGAGSCITVAADSVAVTGNCVDATTLDSIDSGSFLRSDTSDQFTSGTLTMNAGTILDINGNLSIADTDIAFDGASTNFAFTGNFSINTDDLFLNKTSGNLGIGTTAPTSRLSLASDGTAANLFDITDSGSTIFQVTQANMISNVPAQFNAAGDVSIAYDLNFTNPTASYIKSNAPLYLTSGKTYNSSDLTLETYNKGNVIVNTEALSLTGSATISAELTLSNKTTNGGVLYTNGSGLVSQSDAPSSNECLIFNGTSPVWDSCASGGGITGSGTTNYVPKFTGASSIGNSTIYDNGNVGIGTTTTTQKLTVLGSIDASVQFLGQAADTAAAPSFSWTGDTNVGMYRPTTDTIGFTTAGSEKVRIASNGNVGIGSTSPGQKLDVNGVARATNFYVNAAAGNGIGFWNGAPSTYGIFMSNSASYQYGDVTDYYIANVMSSGTSRGFVWSYGTVPSMALNANSGNLALKGNLTVNGTGNSSIAGNLGIGTTVPGANLGIIPSTGNASILLSADPSNTVETHNPFLKLTQDGGIVTGILGFSGAASVDAEGTAFTGGLDNSLQLINKYSTNLQLGTNGAARLTISNAGLVTLANYTTSGGLLYTNGSGLVAQTGTGTGSQCLLGGATPSWGSCSTGSITGSGTTNYLAKFTGSGTIGNSTIYDNGNVGIGTTVPNALLAVAGNTRINGIQVDESLGYDQPIYFSPQAYFEAGSTTAPFPVYTIDGFTTVNDTSVPFSKVASSTSYDQIYSDYIPVQPGDTLYGEMWAHRASGAVGTAGTLYYGIERYDKDKNPIAINNGTDYFVAAGQTVPTTGVWTKYSSQTTLPTSHTVYNSSDGGPVRYVRVRILVNYNAGTIPTEWGGIILRRVAPYRDSGNIAFNGNVGIGSLSPAYNLDVNGTFRASSTSNAVFGNGTTGGLTIGDGQLTKTSGFGFQMNSGLTISQNLTVSGTGTNTFEGDISLGSADQIQFATTAEDKLYLYTNTYGIGIESSTLTNWSGSQFRWRTGGTSVSTGTERMLLTTTGLTLVGDLAVNGGDITSTVDLTLNPAGGDVILADTRTLMIGGHAGAIAYNAISNAGGAANSGVVTTDNDLYIQGDLEVDGAVHGGSFVGSINPGFTLGSVPFQGASGLTQDNANFYWDDTNNRLGIGTAAPSHTLTVASGSVAAPQIYDYDNTAYYMDLAATGNSILAAGNAGIGTTSPLVKLHVVKTGVAQTWTPDAFDDVAIFEGSGSTSIGILSGNTGYGQITFSDIDDRDVGRIIYGHTNNTMSFFTSDTERITILSNGNVGIGSTAPVQKLQVAGYVRGDTGLCISTDCRTSWPTGGVTGSGTTNYVAKFTAAGAVGNSSIYDNGNVGVGTASPRTKLHVADNSGIGINSWGGIAQTYSSASIVMGSNIYVDPADVVNRQVRSINTHATYGHAFAEFYGGDIVFNAQTGASTANAIVTKVERMRIEGTNGNVGIGSTAPAQKLDVTGNIALSGTLHMDNAQTMQARNSTGTYETFMWPRWSDNVMYTNFGANGWNIRNNSSSSVMFINSSGSVGIGTTNPDRLFTAYFNNGNTATGLFNIRQDSTGDAFGNFSLGTGGASYSMGIDNSDADKFKIGYSAAGPGGVDSGTRITIQTNGNIGIGTVTAGSKLTVEGGFYASGSMHANASIYIGGTTGTSFWEMKTKANRPTPNECDTASTGGASLDVWCLDYGANNVSEFQIDENGSGAMIGTLFQSSNPDVAEYIPVDDQSINSGDILVATNSDMRNDGEEYDNVLATKATIPYQPTLIGAVSSGNPFLVGLNNPNEIWHKEDVTTFEDKRAMILTGRNYVKVSTINGEIKAGDLITTSTIPGIGMKATRAGFSVGRALQSFNGTSSPHAQIIACPAGTPADVTCAKIMVQLNVAWTDPEVQLADSGNLTITGTDAGSFKVWAGQYNFTRKGGFAEVVVAKLVAGITTTQQLVVNGQTQLLGTVKIGTQTLQEYILSVVQNAGMTNNSSESDQIATNIISPLANGKVTIDGDTEVNGTLKAKKIIADEIEGLDAKIATLSANTIVASQAAITNITNITNVYNTASNSAQTATDSASVASDSAEVATDEADLATDSASASESGDMTEDFIDSEIQTEYMDLASSSAALAYTPTLSSEFATFTKGLMSFGPSTFADVSVTGQFSVNGSLIMAENSINTLGGTLEIQPLAQGDVSFMAGLMTLDTEGNLNVAGNAYFAKDVTVKGTLAAHIISPVPSEDLIIRLPSMLADGPNRDSKLVIQNASGSGVLEITNTGDLTASGAGQFANVAAEGFSIIRGAQADISATQTVASSSAGVATIKANYTERTIVSDFVTEDSLIYLTPVGATGGLQPYVARQTAADPENGIKGSFTIQIPSRALSEMKINWFIVN